MNEQDPRQLDKAVAGLLGLDVLGEAPCRFIAGFWSADNYADTELSLHPVYLKYCYCNADEYNDGAQHLGHKSYCLGVVPFYHLDCNLAESALKQVCGERKLTPLARLEFGKWIVELYDSHACDVAQGDDPSLALAICKALAELENKK